MRKYSQYKFKANNKPVIQYSNIATTDPQNEKKMFDSIGILFKSNHNSVLELREGMIEQQACKRLRWKETLDKQNSMAR